MDPKRKRSLRIIIVLAIVWFAAALPVPFMWSNSSVDTQHSEQYKTYLEIAGIVSIPFIAMGVVWTLKPELATRDSS